RSRMSKSSKKAPAKSHKSPVKHKKAAPVKKSSPLSSKKAPKAPVAKKTEKEEEEKPESKLDILDDPVRMYLKQMGQVPLLTREQEVEISKRIEDAELMVQKFINRFGFTSKSHLDLAQKL